jgi:Rrf2 family protein
MRIGTRICCALRLMTDVARHGGEGPVPLRAVAERQRISRLYLSQLTIPLRGASLLRSVWGYRGGYVLGRPANEISMLDIVDAIDGSVLTSGCLTFAGTRPGGAAAAARK